MIQYVRANYDLHTTSYMTCMYCTCTLLCMIDSNTIRCSQRFSVVSRRPEAIKLTPSTETHADGFNATVNMVNARLASRSLTARKGMTLKFVVIAVLSFLIVLRFDTRNLRGIAFRKHSTVPSCMERAMMILCSHQERDGSTFKTCMDSPTKFFAKRLQASVVTDAEEEARSLLEDYHITAVAIGAGKKEVLESGGRCSAAVPGATLCTDRAQLDLFEFVSWLKLFRGKQSPKVLIAEHVLEHFHPLQIQVIAASAFLMLKPGGVFRIAVPDGYKPSPNYQQYIRAGSTSSGQGQSHMVSWTFDNLTPLFQDAGFKIVPREHFDARGDFQTSDNAYDYDERYGKIKRSFRHDKRNNVTSKNVIVSKSGRLDPSDLKPGEPIYTSLWFDAVKPKDCVGGDALF